MIFFWLIQNNVLYLQTKNNIMVVDCGIANLNSFLEKHQKLTDAIMMMERIENILTNDQMRYVYLGTLISSDTVFDTESASKSLEKLLFIKENIKYMNLDEELFNDVNEFIGKGIEIVKNDLNNFKGNGTDD